MSVNSHLVDTASKLIITDYERSVIDGHIGSLSNKISEYFLKTSITEHFAFGSYTRKTLMPRKADDNSDVDYMVIFSNSEHAPSTYLSKLKDFAKAKYSTSDIYQDHPTVVLELSRIKIELVPAIKSAYDNYQIPAPSSSYTRWLNTHPNDFNSKVRTKNTNEKKLIRPLIRLMKYWNAQNGYVYSSYELENLIVSHYYGYCQTLWDYLYSFINGLSSYNPVEWKSTKLKKLKEICSSARSDDNQGYPALAEAEIKKAFPVY